MNEKYNDQMMEAMKRLNEAIGSLGHKQVCILIGYVDVEGIPHILKEGSTKDHDLAYHLVVAKRMLTTNLEFLT